MYSDSDVLTVGTSVSPLGSDGRPCIDVDPEPHTGEMAVGLWLVESDADHGPESRPIIAPD